MERYFFYYIETAFRVLYIIGKHEIRRRNFVAVDTAQHVFRHGFFPFAVRAASHSEICGNFLLFDGEHDGIFYRGIRSVPFNGHAQRIRSRVCRHLIAERRAVARGSAFEILIGDFKPCEAFGRVFSRSRNDNLRRGIAVRPLVCRIALEGNFQLILQRRNPVNRRDGNTVFKQSIFAFINRHGFVI